VRLTILLDTLDNLRLGGRADGVIAIAERMTRALNIKSVINAERTGFPRERIWVRETGAVLPTHGGRGVIGVMAVPAK